MAVWWEGYTAFQQAMFVIAATSTLLMIIFLVMMLFGIHGDSFDGDADVDASGLDHGLDHHIDSGADSFNDEPLSAFSGLRLLTLRSALAFLAIGGWVALIMSSVAGIFWSIVVAILSGAAASVLLSIAFRQAMRLESVGNIRYENAIGKTGSVYLKIPANFSGKGKVNLTLQERYVEVDAMTKDTEDIRPGSVVMVTALENETTLIVTKQSKPNQ